MPVVMDEQISIEQWQAYFNEQADLKKRNPFYTENDNYIREHPTCFYVTGFYLDRERGWKKLPQELPTFDKWTLVDVVLFSKSLGTVWMELGKWEAKHWCFKSVEPRRDETEMLAWAISREESCKRQQT